MKLFPLKDSPKTLKSYTITFNTIRYNYQENEPLCFTLRRKPVTTISVSCG